MPLPFKLLFGTLFTIAIAYALAGVLEMNAAKVAIGAVVGYLITSIGFAVVDALAERYRQRK